MKQKETKINLGKLEIDLVELGNFITKAKTICYAGEGKEEILADGSKCLIFQRGNFYYTDNYAGYYQAPGDEIVRWQRPEGQRVWQMSYSGGIEERFFGDKDLAKKTFTFLKKALLEVSLEKPFRGPENTDFRVDYEGWVWIYRCNTKGDINRFIGSEIITTNFGNGLDRRVVFSQHYIGGLIIPK